MADHSKNDTSGTATDLGMLGVAGSPNGTNINFIQHDSVSTEANVSNDRFDYFKFSPEILSSFLIELNDLSVRAPGATSVYFIVAVVTFNGGADATQKIFVKESGFNGSRNADYYGVRKSVIEQLVVDYGKENVFINKKATEDVLVGVSTPNTDDDEVAFNVTGYSILFDNNGKLKADEKYVGGLNYTLNIHSKSGSNKSDKITGTDKGDTINSLKGNDLVKALGGDDVVKAGGGNDKVLAGSGNDFVNSGTGSDKVAGGTGDDELRAGGGTDKVKGGAGNDLVQGAGGHDKLFGNAGDDEIFGAWGNDFIRPGAGNDEIYTGAGNDRLFFGANQGENVVWDFKVGQDLLDLRAMKFKSKKAVMQNVTFDEGGGLFSSDTSDAIPPSVHISIKGTDIYLTGEDILDFSRSDFLI